jgi:hypothetical protein
VGAGFLGLNRLFRGRHAEKCARENPDALPCGPPAPDGGLTEAERNYLQTGDATGMPADDQPAVLATR